MQIQWTLLKDYTLQRLSERSTWVGLIGLATAAGITISPALGEQIASVGAATAGLLLLVTRDKPTTVNHTTVNPVTVQVMTTDVVPPDKVTYLGTVVAP